MPDPIFAHPLLAAVYDEVEGDRKDLLPYLAIANELVSRDVMDLGCGTGTFALMLARAGFAVIAVDPAAASLGVARRKPDAGMVRWVQGDASAAPDIRVDLVTMTGNVAQAIVDPQGWQATLQQVRARLRRSGRLVFETRDPADEAWRRWTPETSRRFVDVDGVGTVETWIALTAVSLPLVSFCWTWRFHRDGTVLRSDSTLRFRTPVEVERDLAIAGFAVVDVRGAPDRPGRELVFVTRPMA
jgi:SAM-dependent methyltransferase